VIRQVAFAAILFAARDAAAECAQCRTLSVAFTLDAFEPLPGAIDRPPQIVIWLETPDGQYIETSLDGAPLYITQDTGRFGLGNRPGRMDFNSGPLWPYGRRENVFPIWAHRHAAQWGMYPRVVFQSNSGLAADDALSHSMAICSVDEHYCRPMQSIGGDKPNWDAQTCASPGMSYTDKGKLSATAMSLYPPRADLTRRSEDTLDVDMYGVLNTFDAVSQATPEPLVPTQVTWAIPGGFPSGDYIVWIEVSREFDHNASYNASNYPSPIVPYGDYGLPYRGQPSVVYQVPITIDGATAFTAATTDYVGYGDPDAQDGDLRAPDATITTDRPGSGASRFKLEVDAGGMYRARVALTGEQDCELPGAPTDVVHVASDRSSSTVSFVAPGEDGAIGTPASYEIRYRAGGEITEADFATAIPIEQSVAVVPPGTEVLVTIQTLLPMTEYTVAMRAVDNCGNVGPLATVAFVTPERTTGSVDACFVATAAYGSVMANDVALLRKFRDTALRNSVIGELVVESYYTFGPAVAGVVGESELLRATARASLAPVIDWVKTQ